MEETIMKRLVTYLTLYLLGFGMVCQLYGCLEEQCGVEGLDYFVCT